MASIVVSSRSNAIAFLRVTVQPPRGAESREGGVLPLESRQPRQEQWRVRSRPHRPWVWRQRKWHLDHGGGVARPSSWGKPAAETSAGGPERLLEEHQTQQVRRRLMPIAQLDRLSAIAGF